MNAYDTTAADLARVLTGGRAPVEYRIVSKSFHRGSTTYGISIDGKLYEVGDYTLKALDRGCTPEELELEDVPWDRDEIEAEDRADVRSTARHERGLNDAGRYL